MSDKPAPQKTGATKVIPPGSTIGILGGGQLGRMTALAAATLGYRCHVFAPESDSPAALVSENWTWAAWEDQDALERFAATVDVITYEFENVPAPAAAFLSTLKPVRPGPRALEMAQHRAREKEFFASIGIPVAPWAPVHDVDGLHRAAAEIGLPAILKTAREGYDGKGQARIFDRSEIATAWGVLDGREGVLETLIPFESEMSVIVARGVDGSVLAFPPGTNVHSHGILATSTIPSSAPVAAVEAAMAHGRRLAEALDLVGLVALELFVTKDGQVLANEMAPRPHNSGHWSMDACRTSQFEQLVRAICGLPLGPVDILQPVVMENLVGIEVERWREAVADPKAKLHLYGKTRTRSGRKMGHINRLKG
jgi:5-(carboxyamino)imidazole ribonucleotide synthase